MIATSKIIMDSLVSFDCLKNFDLQVAWLNWDPNNSVHSIWLLHLLTLF